MDAAERDRQLAMLRRIGAVGGAVFGGKLEPSEDSRRAQQSMESNRSARRTGHFDAADYHMERAYEAACRAYDAASQEQRALLDAHPTPLIVCGDLMVPGPSAIRALLRRSGLGRGR